MTSERAHGPSLLTLVYIDTRLLRPLSKPGVASALVAPRRVGAGAVPAQPGVGGALVRVDAGVPGRVQHVPGGTLAAVGAVGVDAAAAAAQGGAHTALVQVLREVGAPHAALAHAQELRRRRGRAVRAVAAPRCTWDAKLRTI